MFEQVLPGNTKIILALLGKSNLFEDAYLAGGTGCALQVGHRFSFDLDFFTPKKFDEENLVENIKRIKHFRLEDVRWQTVLEALFILKMQIRMKCHK